MNETIQDLKEQLAELEEENNDILENQIDDLTRDFIDQYKDQFTTDDYIEDLINEFCDNEVSIYYSDLDEWVKGNSSWVEDAVSNGLVDMQHFDYYKALQAGQYMENQDTIYNDKEQLDKYIENLKQIEELKNQIENEED